MPNLLTAYRVARAIMRTDATKIETYEDLLANWRRSKPGGLLSDEEIRKAHREWLHDKLRDDIKLEIALEVARVLPHRLQSIATLVAVVLTTFALLFPPFYLVQGGQTVHLGFRFVFDNQAGTINSPFLAVEILGFIAMYAVVCHHARSLAAAPKP